MASARFSRALAALSLLTLALFVLFMALAARAYPGGTYCEPGAVGHRFWGNFFCDLTARVTRRGADNALSAAYARLAFACFSAATAPFWWLAGGLSSRRIGSWVRGLGLVSAGATNLIAWAPSALAPSLHVALVFIATLPGLAAALAFVAGLFARSHRLLGLLGASGVIAGASNAAGYAWAVAASAACVPWLPALQKVTALLFMAWIASVALAAERARR